MVTRRRQRPPQTSPVCNRSCCNAPARFRSRLALALHAPEVPGHPDVALSAAQIAEFTDRYGGIADEQARHFIVRSRGLGLGGDA